MSWTQERIDNLIKLWTSGKSASIVAKELGNISRNAVIGKVHRLGIANRSNAKKVVSPIKITADSIRIKLPKSAKLPSKKNILYPGLAVSEDDDFIKIKIKDKLKSKKRPIHPPRKTLKQQVLAYNPEASRTHLKMSLLELKERTCRWPSGDPKDVDFHFCGCETIVGSSYCKYHSQFAYTQTTKRENKQYITVDTKNIRNEESSDTISMDIASIRSSAREHINCI